MKEKQLFFDRNHSLSACAKHARKYPCVHNPVATWNQHILSVIQAHGILINLFYFLDERLIPNPPMDIQFSDEIDTRIGFFGHVILNISWESPQSMHAI